MLTHTSSTFCVPLQCFPFLCPIAMLSFPLPHCNAFLSFAPLQCFPFLCPIAMLSFPLPHCNAFLSFAFVVLCFNFLSFNLSLSLLINPLFSCVVPLLFHPPLPPPPLPLLFPPASLFLPSLLLSTLLQFPCRVWNCLRRS